MSKKIEYCQCKEIDGDNDLLCGYCDATSKCGGWYTTKDGKNACGHCGRFVSEYSCNACGLNIKDISKKILTGELYGKKEVQDDLSKM